MPSSPENEQQGEVQPQPSGEPQGEGPGSVQSGEGPAAAAGEAAPAEGAAEGDARVELAEARALSAQLEDRYKRALADLDNYRKRAARELERRVEESREQLLRDWLLALDSLERALRMEPPDSPALSGLQAVLEQMEAILERYGVTRMGATGERFDPERHEAVGVHAAGDVPDHTIVDVARSGFVLGDRVLRPAEVIVARGEEARG